MEKQTHTLYAHGMHCASCECFLEEALKKADGVRAVRVSLAARTVHVETIDGSAQELAERLTALVEPRGYRLALTPPRAQVAWKDFGVAIPVATLAILALTWLEGAGILSFGGGGVGMRTAFFVGLVASVSTCMATVGALVLSLSAQVANRAGSTRHAWWFHAGRVAGFFVLGGAIGWLGQTVRLGIMGQAIISIGVSAVLVVLGVHMLEVLPGVSRFLPRMPRRFSALVGKTSALPSVFGPLMLGAATFFLPCGFTQSMQLAALTSGTAWQGARIMLAFALGTLPMLALLSFASYTVVDKPWRSTFFKAAGLVVVFLATITLYRQAMLLVALAQ